MGGGEAPPHHHMARVARAAGRWWGVANGALDAWSDERDTLRPAAPAHAAYECPTPEPRDYGGGSVGLTLPPTLPEERLSANFTPTSACDVTDREVSGRGNWIVVVKNVADTGIAPLTAAFREPDAPPMPEVDPVSGLPTPCTADAVLLPSVVLQDEAGRLLHPRPPEGPCGKPLATVRAAYEALQWHEVDVRLVRPTSVHVPEPSKADQLSLSRDKYLAKAREMEMQPQVFDQCAEKMRQASTEDDEFRSLDTDPDRRAIVIHRSSGDAAPVYQHICLDSISITFEP